MNKVLFIFGLLLFFSKIQAQEIDSSYVEIDSMSVDTIAVMDTEIALINPDALICFYEKLAQMKSTDSTSLNQKINFVHIGDSHIQADLMTNVVRERLQKEYGNAGRGLVFPYNLAKTNGPWNVQFSSNGSLYPFRNVKYLPN